MLSIPPAKIVFKRPKYENQTFKVTRIHNKLNRKIATYLQEVCCKKNNKAVSTYSNLLQYLPRLTNEVFEQKLSLL